MRKGARELIRAHPSLVVSFFAYYSILIGYGVVGGAPQTVFYALFVGGAAAYVAWIFGRTRLSGLTLWGLGAWGFGHMMGGLIEISGRVIYEHPLGAGEFRIDKIVHLFGFGFATLAAYEVIRKRMAPDAPARSVAIAAALVGLGLGAINETVEFGITLLPGDSNVGGFSNTGWDLVANAAGAATAAIWAASKDPLEPGSDLR